MKKMLVTIVLVFAAMVANQESAQSQAQPAAPQQPAAQQPAAAGQPAQPGQTAQPGQPAAQPQQKKEIKDPAEYNAYVGAVQQTDPNAKISGLEAFLQQYPNSVMKEDALELLMVSYQQTNNAAKMSDAANRLLQANPHNVRALALLAFSERAQQKWQDAEKHAVQGLESLPQMQKGEGISDADFQKQKTQISSALNGIAGFSALQLKDYATAAKYLRPAVEADPNNLENVYPLALAYLSSTPPDNLNGLFFIARAAGLAKDPAGKDQITKFGRSKYVKYHGSDQGWNELLATASSTPLPPQGFTITQYVPPTPAEQAADLVKTKKPEEMTFAEWELVLSAGKQEDADKVWTAIKGKSLQMEAQVMKATSTRLEIAASQDDIDQKRTDVLLDMTGPIPARLMPKEGQTLAFEGTPMSYEPSPFVMTMSKGALLTKAAPKAAPTKRKAGSATRRKKAAAQ
jgi:tetratricopeptide (TPR) repeat protein